MLPVIIFLSAFCLLGINANGDENLHTLKYTEETFPVEIAKKNHFVMFYAPWCDHCKTLAPVLEALAAMFNKGEENLVTIAKVDCVSDSVICSEHDVTGYPTLKIFKVGEKEGTKFRGSRDLASMTAFIHDQLGNRAYGENPAAPEPVNGLVELTEETFDKHVASGYHFVKFYAPWCGHCQKLAPTWDELGQSMSHDKTVSIGKVDCTQHRSVCEQFDIKGYPTLLWIEDGKKIDKYIGQRSHGELKAYVDKMLRASDDKVTEKHEDPEETVQSVLTLTGDNFQHGIDKGVTFIEFFAPWCGHCKRLAPTWEELGKKFTDNENVHIVKVDCTLATSKTLCDEQEVDGFPTLFLYRDGQKVAEYNGARTLDDLYEFVNNHLKSHDEL